MDRIRRFVLLSREEKNLLIRAAWLLWICRLGLWLLPFKVLRRHLAKAERRSAYKSKGSTLEINKITWAVAVASRYVPVATCLTQALAGQVLLKQHCVPALLRIGVMKNQRGAFQAHAWIESQGGVVIGDAPDLALFTELPSEGELV